MNCLRDRTIKKWHTFWSIWRSEDVFGLSVCF